MSEVQGRSKAATRRVDESRVGGTADREDRNGGRRALVIAVCGTVLVLLIRLWFGRHMNFCGTPDSCAYQALAESLSRHHGFVENFLYDYQLDSLRLPASGIEYWLPGTSFVLLLAQPFGGVTLHSSIVIATLVGVLLAAAAWKLAMDWSGSRWIACGSYLLCLVLPPLWGGSITPDSTLFYGAAVAWFLALFRVRFRSYAEDGLALLCLVAANLIRNDGILLLIPVLVVLLLRWRSKERRGASVGYCAVALAAFFAAMLPIHGIDLAVMGNAFPSGSAKALYMNDLADMGKYGEPVTLHSFLAAGAGKLIKIRVAAFPLIVYRIVFVLVGFAAIFWPALALRRERGERAAMPEIAGAATFAIVLVLVYSFMLPAIGSFSALRAFTGLLPMSASVALAGMVWVTNSRRAATWVAGAAVLFYLIAGTMEDRRTVPEMNELAAKAKLVGGFLLAQGADPQRGSVVMTTDPAQFSETTAFAAVPLPENGLEAARHAADDLHVTHVLIDTDKLKGSLAEVKTALDAAEMAPVPGTHVVVVTLRRR